MYTIEELDGFVSNCTKCELYKTRLNTVLGDGNINADIMLIGEAPGKNEDLTGNAFVGKAGKLLDKMLNSINLTRKDVYISNIVKCRPPENRNPLAPEIKACMEYLRWQYVLVKPKIVVILGSVAGKVILGKDFKITKQHGEVIEINGVKFLPTFHPAALLRDESKKKDAWHDLLVLKDLIKNESN